MRRLTIFVNPHQPAWVDAMNIEHGFLNLAVNKTHLHAEVSPLEIEHSDPRCA